MGGCAAPFCNNSSKKGYHMKVFPRDPQRRALWERNVPRENWTATNNSSLCEMHFAPEMWEHRRDGKRKLKSEAIPTLFGFFVKKDTDVSRNKEASKEPVEEQPSIEDLECNTTKNTAECITVNVIPECNAESNIVDAVDTSTMENNEIIKEECVTVLTASTSDTCTSESEKLKELKEKQKEKYDELIKQRLNIIRMRKKIRALEYMKQSLQHKIKNDKYMKALRRIFNEDQIAALCTKSQRGRNWSNETLQRALKLKLVCGNHGYEEILRQGYPFPSLRTLRRRLEDFKRESEISKMFAFSTHEVESYFQEDTDTEDNEASTEDITVPNETDYA
ncbi:uncharacterized protein [Temnothorax nylanderi]|uniref:uncharacterized protein isoform X2 n=1 Tax=Temnothorax nylanderi TaxID=102681 RepID=UPI003A894B6E